MIARQPYLPRFMAGGPGNPLGARAMYLGSSIYRIHGTNDPSTIGKFVSSGCIRLTNEDVAGPVQPGRMSARGWWCCRRPRRGSRRASPERRRSASRPLPGRQAGSGRQAMNLSAASIY